MKYFLLCLLVLTVVGCSSEPPPEYFYRIDPEGSYKFLPPSLSIKNRPYLFNKSVFYRPKQEFTASLIILQMNKTDAQPQWMNDIDWRKYIEIISLKKYNSENEEKTPTSNCSIEWKTQTIKNSKAGDYYLVAKFTIKNGERNHLDNGYYQLALSNSSDNPYFSTASFGIKYCNFLIAECKSDNDNVNYLSSKGLEIINQAPVISQEEYKTALEYVDRSLKIKPENDLMLLTKALIHEKLDQIQEAINYYAKTIDLWKKNQRLIHVTTWSKLSSSHNKWTDFVKKAEQQIKKLEQQ